MAFEQTKGTQIAILMVPTTQPEDIASYANRVGNAWKIGRKGMGDGVLLVVAKDDRKVRIEVAKTLEGAIPDLAAKQIIDEAITPNFRKGDFAGGLHAGVDQLIARITGEALPAPERPRRATRRRRGLRLDGPGHPPVHRRAGRRAACCAASWDASSARSSTGARRRRRGTADHVQHGGGGDRGVRRAAVFAACPAAMVGVGGRRRRRPGSAAGAAAVAAAAGGRWRRRRRLGRLRRRRRFRRRRRLGELVMARQGTGGASSAACCGIAGWTSAPWQGDPAGPAGAAGAPRGRQRESATAAKSASTSRPACP